MSYAIDCAEPKQQVSIERVAEILGFRLKRSGEQLRGACPICKEDGDRIFVITPG